MYCIRGVNKEAEKEGKERIIKTVCDFLSVFWGEKIFCAGPFFPFNEKSGKYKSLAASLFIFSSYIQKIHEEQKVSL
jgi:hypothetical protein